MTTPAAPIDVTDATFEREVLERSKTTPVVVDLWAPWCGPCRQLTPILEEVIGATGGAVVLAKVNVDENPGISQAFRVQSIPAVYALRDGKPAGHFLGARPRREVEELVNSLLPTTQEGEVAALVAAGDELSLRKAIELDGDHEPAIVALAGILADDGRGDEALELLARIPESPETRRVSAMVRTGDVAGSDIETTLTELLERVRDDDGARQQFVDLLERLGPDDPRTAAYRRKLAATLF